MRLVLLAAILTAFGCSEATDRPEPETLSGAICEPLPGPCYGTYRLDTSIQGYSVWAQEAVDGLNQWLGHDAVRLDYNGNCTVVLEQSYPGTWGGQYRPAAKQIAVTVNGFTGSEEHRDDLFRVILEHEIMHSLGMNHVEPGSSVMSPYLDWNNKPTELDKQECLRVGQCECSD